MIESVRIRNFKSLLDVDIDLGHFTVIVGANGSGKSNLIKALEFLSAIPRSGVAAAVNRYGGFKELVPKSVSSTELRKTHVTFKYRVRLPAPPGYERDLPPLYVDHFLDLAYSPREIVRVAREELVFHQVLTLAEILQAGPEDEIEYGPELYEPSTFTLSRGPRGAIAFSADPPLSMKVSKYLAWFGLPYLQESITTFAELSSLLDFLSGKRNQQKDATEERIRRNQSFLDPETKIVISQAPQARVFQLSVASIMRFDLRLGELRTEQDVSDSPSLSPVGNNMPSVLRHLRSDPDRKRSWNRILNTLTAIAPHVVSMGSKPLRTGKEFVEFEERGAGRKVESWESSDGTLRALAILLALETHPGSDTLLIEEPEQNLHPWAVRSIIDHIREVIEDRDLQVILTTHSPQVLERVYPEEVLVSSRSEIEGTKLNDLQDVLPNSKIHMGEVADLWVKGLLGGVPSDE